MIVIIIVTSAYVLFYMDEENNNNGNNNDEIDEEPPTIDSITGDTTAKSGERVKISVSFSDNVEVTEAKIFYKMAGEDWKSDDILSGSFNIDLPSNSTKKWYYYIIVDDEAGNGPVGNPSTDGSKFYTITVIIDNGNGNNNEARIVFIEESTAVTCKYCTNVAKILNKLYDPDDPDFYYISLVEDENSKAKDRVENHYKRIANPTLYIDGGYEVMLGIDPAKEDEYESNLKQNIKNAANRDVPELITSLKARWNETRSELSIELNIENRESVTYTGNLKIYIAEIQSRWIDYNGDPFHYAFIDYAMNEDITIQSNDNVTFSKIWNASNTSFSDIYPENIMVFAVVFNSEKNKGYSNPPDKSPFDAYYTDAVVATKIKEGTLPPTIGIITPKENHRHVFGIFKMKYWLLILLNASSMARTVIIGRGTIEVSVEAEAGVERVEFYIDGKLRYNSTEDPFKYSFRKIGRVKNFILDNKHTILVKVYDTEGRIATDSIDVVTYFL